jgi:hypothetical protein
MTKSPLLLAQAKQLDAKADSGNFDKIWQNVTGIRIQRRQLMRASALGFRSSARGTLLNINEYGSFYLINTKH